MYMFVLPARGLDRRLVPSLVMCTCDCLSGSRVGQPLSRHDHQLCVCMCVRQDSARSDGLLPLPRAEVSVRRRREATEGAENEYACVSV